MNEEIISKHMIAGVTICAFIGFLIGGIISQNKAITIASMVLGAVVGTIIGVVIGTITGHYVASKNINKMKQINKYYESRNTNQKI
jgi:membrane protein DedA with SNARE-associated domain